MNTVGTGPLVKSVNSMALDAGRPHDWQDDAYIGLSGRGLSIVKLAASSATGSVGLEARKGEAFNVALTGAL